MVVCAQDILFGTWILRIFCNFGIDFAKDNMCIK